jgi:hypothetical protein
MNRSPTEQLQVMTDFETTSLYRINQLPIVRGRKSFVYPAFALGITASVRHYPVVFYHSRKANRKNSFHTD